MAGRRRAVAARAVGSRCVLARLRPCRPVSRVPDALNGPAARKHPSRHGWDDIKKLGGGKFSSMLWCEESVGWKKALADPII